MHNHPNRVTTWTLAVFVLHEPCILLFLLRFWLRVRMWPERVIMGVGEGVDAFRVMGFCLVGCSTGSNWGSVMKENRSGTLHVTGYKPTINHSTYYIKLKIPRTVPLLAPGAENESVELAAQKVPLLLQIFNALLEPGVLFQRHLQLCSKTWNQKVRAARWNVARGRICLKSTTKPF